MFLELWWAELLTPLLYPTWSIIMSSKLRNKRVKIKEISKKLLVILYNSGFSRGGDVQVPIVSDAGPSVIPRMSRWHTCPTLHQSPSKGSAYLESQLRVPKRLKSKQNLRRGSLSLLTKRLRLSQPSRDKSRCEQLVKKPVDADSEEVAASFFYPFCLSASSTFQKYQHHYSSSTQVDF